VHSPDHHHRSRWWLLICALGNNCITIHYTNTVIYIVILWITHPIIWHLHTFLLNCYMQSNKKIHTLIVWGSGLTPSRAVSQDLREREFDPISRCFTGDVIIILLRWYERFDDGESISVTMLIANTTRCGGGLQQQ